MRKRALTDKWYRPLFFAKNCKKFCALEKKLYLCTAFRKVAGVVDRAALEMR